MKGGTCRCALCGRKNANSNHVRNQYLKAGLRYDEYKSGLLMTKQQTHKILRKREKEVWMQELDNEMEFV